MVVKTPNERHDPGNQSETHTKQTMYEHPCQVLTDPKLGKASPTNDEVGSSFAARNLILHNSLTLCASPFELTGISSHPTTSSIHDYHL